MPPVPRLLDFGPPLPAAPREPAAGAAPGLAREVVLCPAVAEVDWEELAPHSQSAGCVRCRCGERGASEGAGESCWGQGPSCPRGERKDGGEPTRREPQELPAPFGSRSSCLARSRSKGDQSDDGEKVDAAPGGREHP